MASEAKASEGDSAKPTVSVTAIPEPVGDSADGTASTLEAPSEADDTSTTALPIVEPAPLQDAKDH